MEGEVVVARAVGWEKEKVGSPYDNQTVGSCYDVTTQKLDQVMLKCPTNFLKRIFARLVEPLHLSLGPLKVGKHFSNFGSLLTIKRLSGGMILRTINSI